VVATAASGSQGGVPSVGADDGTSGGMPGWAGVVCGLVVTSQGYGRP
jgi:hypothetical protein